MDIIPVLDLKDGVVVHAHMGRRDQYRPIETPLSPSSMPADVARGLLAIYPFKAFYVADLDAIERKGNNNGALALLRNDFPNLALWVDNGVNDLRGARQWLDADLGHLVLGSETQTDERLVTRCGGDERVILSLDYLGDSFLGPVALRDSVHAWPSKIIVMTLARVGSQSGPDIPRLNAIKSRAPEKQLYAAGGVRDTADLAALAHHGIAGALVATSLHNGRLTGAQIASL
ncbi:MAG: nickel transporter [Bradyrhizobiaceae bacterium]|nr:nickel transporter [Bradyrhizobiaceae bacterium]